MCVTQDMQFTVSPANINRFIMIILFTTYMRMPRQDMYWSKDTDIPVSLVSKAMNRQKFHDIKKCLLFVDNLEKNHTNDRFKKIQPLYDLLNANLKQFGINHGGWLRRSP